jgi:hypothetical protein
MTVAFGALGRHRMTDPLVRRRTAVVLLALFAVMLATISLLGRPTGPFTADDLRSVSGLPIVPPQIERRIAPPAPETDLQQQIDDLLNGVYPTQPSPAPEVTGP